VGAATALAPLKERPPPGRSTTRAAPLAQPAAVAPRSAIVAPMARPGADVQGDGESARIRKLTCFDSLTGLPNRLLFREQLDLVLRLAQRNRHAVAVLLADIDDFRRIKLSLGHQRSDELVKLLAQRLQQALRSSDLVAASAAPDRSGVMARLAGTEFAIVLTQLTDPQDAARVALRLREAASAALQLGGIEVFPTISIGIALSHGEGATPESLLEQADLALGFARDQGRDRTNFYDAAMDAAASSRIELEGGLRNALADRQFALEFQARVDGRTGVASSSEALLRWRHPQRGMLAPGAFIDVAEQSQLIVPIGHWVLEAACQQNRAWQDSGIAPLPVGVNVSAHQVCRPDFLPSIARALELSGLEPRWLELEVTESALLMDTAGALRALGEVKKMGVRLAIDDFGTGYSSLSYLRDFPFDVLKIDRSFTQRLPADERTAAITQGIIELSQRLGMEVVAEGVETDAQRRALLSYGCVQMQGFLFSRPAAPSALAGVWRQPVAGDLLRRRA
jgi:diguanylate cyclase (GGDEF)-like protein